MPAEGLGAPHESCAGNGLRTPTRHLQKTVAACMQRLQRYPALHHAALRCAAHLPPP